MLAITSTKLTPEQVEALEIDCDSVDYASIFAAKQTNAESFDGCKIPGSWAVAFRPAEDIIISINLCDLHYGALKLAVREGVAIDNDFFD